MSKLLNCSYSSLAISCSSFIIKDNWSSDGIISGPFIEIISGFRECSSDDIYIAFIGFKVALLGADYAVIGLWVYESNDFVWNPEGILGEVTA
jgi:hypothetical protein